MESVLTWFLDNFTANPLAFSISMLALLLEIVIYQFKEMRWIVIGQGVSNFLILLTYALGDGLSGAAVCAWATVHTLLIFRLYQKQGRDIPLWFVAASIAVYLICSVITYKGLIDLLPAGAAVLFAWSVVQSNSKRYRLIILVNSLLWIAYDLIISAPIPMLITHSIAVGSVLVGILRLDVSK